MRDMVEVMSPLWPVLPDHGDAGETWVVILESAPRPAFGFDRVKQIVSCLDRWRPCGVYGGDRYRVQLAVPASRTDEALRLALACHDQALHAMGVTRSALVRAEVLTLEEHQLTWEETVETLRRRPAQGTLIPKEVYDATRSLLRASSASEVEEIVVHFVLAVGGTVNLGDLGDAPGHLSVDLGLRPDDLCYATADRASPTSLILQESLPALVADAQRTRARLLRAGPGGYVGG
ncbi:MAG: hypothetical protein M3256_25130 [Actinomycetota bacterium]|nr:hypothetical protein [Actinomycetota bacterium]